MAQRIGTQEEEVPYPNSTTAAENLGGGQSICYFAPDEPGRELKYLSGVKF